MCLAQRPRQVLLALLDRSRPYVRTIEFKEVEGAPSRRTVVIENGVLKSYLLNSYTARKLGMKTTGNASRGTGYTQYGAGC